MSPFGRVDLAGWHLESLNLVKRKGIAGMAFVCKHIRTCAFRYVTAEGLARVMVGSKCCCCSAVSAASAASAAAAVAHAGVIEALKC